MFSLSLLLSTSSSWHFAYWRELRDFDFINSSFVIGEFLTSNSCKFSKMPGPKLSRILFSLTADGRHLFLQLDIPHEHPQFCCENLYSWIYCTVNCSCAKFSKNHCGKLYSLGYSHQWYIIRPWDCQKRYCVSAWHYLIGRYQCLPHHCGECHN